VQLCSGDRSKDSAAPNREITPSCAPNDQDSQRGLRHVVWLKESREAVHAGGYSKDDPGAGPNSCDPILAPRGGGLVLRSRQGLILESAEVGDRADFKSVLYQSARKCTERQECAYIILIQYFTRALLLHDAAGNCTKVQIKVSPQVSPHAMQLLRTGVRNRSARGHSRCRNFAECRPRQTRQITL
jgi:hypothetical protein